MADTPTLDRIITACTDRGARVRLIGDDQQLAAIGAGGVLRDIATTHGAVRLERWSGSTTPSSRGVPGAARRRPRRSGTTSTTTASTPATSTPSSPRCSSRGRTRPRRPRVPDARPDPRSRRAAQPALPATPASTARDPADEVALADGNQASVGDTILTRTQRPPPRRQRHRLGQERRPLDRHRAPPRRRPHASGTCGPGSTSRCPRSTSPTTSSSATPPPSTPPKAAPPTSCTASSPATRTGNCSTRCSPAAAPRTTSTSSPTQADTGRAVPARDRRAAHRRRDPRPDHRPRRRRGLGDHRARPRHQPRDPLHEAAGGTPTPSPPPPSDSWAQTPMRRSKPPAPARSRGSPASPPTCASHPRVADLPDRPRRPRHHLADAVRRDAQLPPALRRFDDVLTDRLRDE